MRKKSKDRTSKEYIKFLTPTKRTTKIDGKEYTHYVIATSIPKEWKDKTVKVMLEPAKGLLRIKGKPRFWEMVEKHLDQEAKEWEAKERHQKQMQWEREHPEEAKKLREERKKRSGPLTRELAS